MHDAHDVGHVRVKEIKVGRQRVVAVLVEPRRDGFAQTSDGRVLVRKGARNRALVGQDVWRFLAQRQLGTFESTESSVDLEDRNPEALEALARAHQWDGDREQIEPRLRERNLLGPGRKLTIAGALLLTDPSKSMGTKLHIDVRGYDGPKSRRYVRRDEVRGTLADQVRHAAELVSRDIGTDFFVLNLRRREVPRLPADVVREAIANAVAHRSYEDKGSAIVIEVRPDRVVVRSPGGFLDGVEPENLRNARKARNPVVIDVLRRFELAEDSGRGVDLIQDQMLAAFLTEPMFEEQDDEVVVTLPLTGLITAEERAWVEELQSEGKLGDPERLLLVHAARGTPLTNASARALTGQDSRDARRSLARLRDEGLLLQHGVRGGSFYELGSFPRRGSVPVTRERLERIVLEAAQERPVSNANVRELTGLDRAGARALLRGLVGEGLLIQHGERRGTMYTASSA